MGIKIKDAELVERVTGEERIPVSDGSGKPKAVSTDQIKEYVTENAGDENVQSDWAETDTTSDAYIKNKPAIPNEVTEETIKGWGFTKNTGDYSKPSGGIPKSDLGNAVQESLGKADTAIQSHQDISHLATKSELKQDISELGSKVKYIGCTHDKDTNKMIPELYLTGLDKSKIYTVYGIGNYDNRRFVQIFDSNGSDADIYVALAYTTDMSAEVLKVEERESSGISGWVVCNWDNIPDGEIHPFAVIRQEIANNLSSNPRIASEINAEKIAERIDEVDIELNHAAVRLDRLDGITSENISEEDLGVRRNGYYINSEDGKQYSSGNAIITEAVFLNKGDFIEAFSGGTGLALIAFSDEDPTNSTVYEVIAKANNMTKQVKLAVNKEGYYSFSGRNANQGDLALKVNILKYEYEGKIGEIEKIVTKLYDGETKTHEYTLDDLIGEGSLPGYYLHNTQLRIIASANTIVTKPIYLYKGDSVECSTGGTGLLLFAKSPAGSINSSTTGFVSISGELTSFKGNVQEDGWYVFSGRINRTDGTNLKVDIKSYVREKNVYELLAEKEDKSSACLVNSTGFALSVGANFVKDEVPFSPWFDVVDNDGTTYGTYLDDKIDSVPQGDSFIFISDVHYSGNNRHSAKLIDYVRRRLGVKTIIHGGDVINESPTIAGAAKEWLDFNRDFVFRIGGDFKQVCGDHDHNGKYADTGQALPYQFIQKSMNGYNIKELVYDTLYDEQIKEVSTANSWTDDEKKEYDAWKKMHYYFDDSTIRTRFVILHTGWTGDVGLAVDKLGSNVLSEANALYLQMDFLAESLTSCPNGYNVVVVGHNIIGNKGYTVSLSNGTATRYNVNEMVWKGAWKSVSQMLKAFKNKTSIILNYRDWSGEGLKSKQFDFTKSGNPNLVFCMGGDVHWDILGKFGVSESLEPVTIASSLENVVPTEGTISKSDILQALTMTDGADRGYKVLIAPPSESYNDETDSALASNPNKDGTLDAQAFDIVTITDKAIHFTRIGSGEDRVVYISD